MKVTIINGNSRHGSTWNCMKLFIQELSKHETVEITEFTLPKDMPHFCNGCFSCFYNGENTCPHSLYVNPIVTSLIEADLILITSPVYAMDVSGQLKALLDHLCFMWLSHRPNPKMFNKIGLSITTTAGAGLGHTTKTIKNSFKFWGIKKVFSFKNPVSAIKWSDVPPQKQAIIQNEMAKLARKIVKAAKNIDSLPKPIFRSFMFLLMKGMMKKNTWNPNDRKHWENQGWLSGGKPF